MDYEVIGAALGNDAHLAVIMADRTGHIRFWNKGAEALFGHSADVATAHRVDLVVPHAYRDMHWVGFNRTMGTRWDGHPGWSEIEGLHSTGRLVDLEVLLTPLREAGGLTTGVFAMFRRRVPAG